ncbi:hypothetical protein TSMEX_005693 [Taenia solium]|eukprot:TsM_000199700 transcript=TsM_000199700 gene=TsM_000199700
MHRSPSLHSSHWLTHRQNISVMLDADAHIRHSASTAITHALALETMSTRLNYDWSNFANH